MPYWSVALTKAQLEHTAAENLHRQGFDTYIPKYSQGVGKESKIRLLFPRYIFVLITDRWHCINGTRGVSRLILTTENRPAVVPDKAIDDIKSREVKGLVQLTPKDKFQPGDQVRLEQGSVLMYGVVEGMRDADRVRVLIDLLGRKVPVWVDEGSLRAVALESQNE